MTATLAPDKQTWREAPKHLGGSWLGGDLNAFQTKPLEFAREIALKNIPVVRIRFAHTPIYVLNTPQAFKHVLQTNNKNYIKDQRFIRIIIENGRESSLFTTDGEDWLWRRRLMQPMFRRNVIENFSHIIINETNDLIGRWRVLNAPINVEDEMMNLTMQVIGRAMFSVDIRRDAPGLHHAYNYIGPQLVQRFSSLWTPPPFIPTPANRQFRKEIETIRQVLEQTIAERQMKGELQHDLLDMLLAAHDTTHERGFTTAEITAEMSGIMFAGHETTALTLTWAFYLLSQHPDVEARLHAELDEVLDGRLPTMDDLPNLPYNRMILEETMRLYPAVYVTSRQSIEDDVVEGYRIPANKPITINIYGVHMHPHYWPEPERFVPERFSPNGLKQQTKLAYLPFLAGPRRCIGEHFALAEAQLVLATVAQQYRLQLAHKHPLPNPKFALRTADGLHMNVVPR